MFALIYHYLVTLLKGLCSFRSPKVIKVYFETTVIGAIHKIFPDSVITGCNFHCNQCLWTQIQNIRLTVQYEENEQVLLTCRMCAALAHLLVNKVEGWLMVLENEKIISLLCYFVERLMENQNVPVEMGKKHRRGPAVQAGVGIPNKTAS